MDARRAPTPSPAPAAAPTPIPAAAAPPAATLDVSALPPLEEVLDLLVGPLAAWMPLQRWYAHKGSGAPRAAIHGWAALRVAPDHLVLLVVVAVSLEDGTGALYQVPLVLRPAGTARTDEPGAQGEQGAEVTTLPLPDGPVRVVDAARDADGRAALIATLVSGEGAAGPSLGLASHRPVPDAPLPLGRAMRSRVLTGEQSNTSLVVETEGASPLIVKLFRVLQDGENPDVLLQGALTAIGSTRVPALVGSATLRAGRIRTHSLLAQEFLPGVEDAWRLALRRAAAGEDDREALRQLGATVAEVHRDLARALGTVAADPASVGRAVEAMRERLAAVAAEVPQVQAHRSALEDLLGAAGEVDWPALQRIHGDLHLGQVLRAPGRGWVLLDFEGEPLRPLAERSLPDSPLRDVAGMLRSLDYVAGAVHREHGIDASGWAADARAAFLAGYGDGAAAHHDAGAAVHHEAGTAAHHEVGEAGAPGGDLSARAVLLAAFEADKAVYEALYEARNRPDWLPIPLAALERISAPGAEAASAG